MLITISEEKLFSCQTLTEFLGQAKKHIPDIDLCLEKLGTSPEEMAQKIGLEQTIEEILKHSSWFFRVGSELIFGEKVKHSIYRILSLGRDKPKSLYVDSKSALCVAEEWDNTHLAWQNPMFNDEVVSIERIPANWPSATMVSQPWKDYLESIKDLDWIVAGLDISRFSETFGASEEEVEKILEIK